MMPCRFRFCLAGLLTIALAGCVDNPTRPDGPPPDAEARAAMLAGQFELAATQYLKLAEDADSPNREKWLLSAAGARLNQGDVTATEKLLGSIDTRDLPAPLPLRASLLRAELALKQDRAGDVPALLPKGLFANAPGDLARVAYELRSQAFARLKQPVAAASELSLLDLLLNPGQADANRQRIWALLGAAGVADLQAAIRPPPDTFGGWVELAIIAKQYLTEPDVLNRALGAWRARYPGHPASAGLVAEIIAQSDALGRAPKHLALALPLSGKLAQPAGAIRDGFLAAWYADPDSAGRPAITIHDTAGRDIWLVMQEAEQSGADLLVGPLRKDAVAALANAASVPIPTLALNRPAAGAGDAEPSPERETGPPRMLFQFALAPEDEARGVARRALADGYSQAAELTPQGAWGQRVAKAFDAEFTAAGGAVVAKAAFSGEPKDLSPTVAGLLGVDRSRARARQVGRDLRLKLEFEPRIRKDIELIFLAAFPRQALQLRPQLKFHHASNVPVYATSHIFTGRQDAARDLDIDGVIFGDMPWLLDPTRAQPAIHQVLDVALPDAPATFQRLHAFGVDAYRLALEVRRMRAQPGSELRGVTGTLRLNDDNQVERELLWARFKDGLPQVMATEVVNP